MYQSSNIDRAAEHLINIIDSNRCAICDKLDGIRMRYPCGHTSCDDCVLASESCPFCLTPQDSSTFATPSIDKPYTQRSQNARALLNSFETEFNVNVYKRQRICNQLKVEKELFPQCIQAPAKYYNKRKSSKPLSEKRSTITVYPGEEITSLNKMNNSNANVKEWLNKCAIRKPLGDLNHSRSNLNTLKKQPQRNLNTQTKLTDKTLKRSHSEIWSDENDTFNDAAQKKKIKKYVKKEINKLESSTKHTTTKKDDSGIADVEDEVIVIDDSQSIAVDKDLNAWLSVLDAEKYAQSRSTIGSTASELIPTEEIKHAVKIPFYLKSPLSQNCIYCNDYQKIESNDNESADHPNVSIVVESRSLKAIINVSAQNNIKIITKQSIEVQTDFKTNLGDEKCMSTHDVNNAISPVPGSKDISIRKANNVSAVSKLNKSNVIIAESDSDEETEHSASLEVTADVHRSYDEILVLADVDDLVEHSKKPRRAARGYTPTSTDSSDKENYNPNRKKRTANSKKKPVKK